MAEELEPYIQDDKQYLTMRQAAQFLGITNEFLQNEISLGKLEVIHIDSHDFIELQTLITYVENMPQKRRWWFVRF